MTPQMMVWVKEIIVLIGTFLLWIWGIKFAMCLATEIFSRHCRHCGKKV